MIAPNKIYLHGYSFNNEPCKSWDAEPRTNGMRGYPVENAEYLSTAIAVEKQKLISWLKERQSQTFTIAADDLLQEVIDKVKEF